MEKDLTPSERASLLLANMELSEKVNMLHGWPTSDYVGYVPENTRLGIPALTLNDGPQGFRSNSHPGSSTAFPAGMTIGSTWDRDLAEQWGSAMAQEFWEKGSNIQLGPGMNLARVPQCGRNFEYISGADPLLGYEMTGPVIKGIQSQGVIANAKHYLNNNQEINRDTVNENVDERTEHELYMRPFVGAVNAGVGSFMCSYNLINGRWACENDVTLNQYLKSKGDVGFDGFVMSDWGATHSTSIKEGLDQEMPGGDYMGDTLLSAVQNGTIAESVVDDAVGRILRPMFQMGLFDKANPNVESNVVTSPAHAELARALSSASQILLKNDEGVLPFSLNSPKKLLLVGKAARVPIVAGGGSGAVFPADDAVISPWAGFLDILGLKDPEPVVVNCDINDVSTSQYNQWGCEGAPASTLQECADKCEGYAPCNAFSFSGTWCDFYPTTAYKVPSLSGKIAGACTRTRPEPQWVCNSADFCIATIDGTDDEQTATWAAQADVSAVFVAQFAKEGSDRDSLSFDLTKHSSACQLPQDSADQMIINVAKSSKQTVVAATAPGAALTPWRDHVQGIVYSYIPGQGYGGAITDVMFGKVNPTGHLSVTLPLGENDTEMTRKQYPGINKQGEYTEGLYIDYRWYTKNRLVPAFPFGHGLSYTQFEYSDIKIDSSSRTVAATIRNAGTTAGAEVAQLYLSFPDTADEPPIQLRGFEKTTKLAPGESQTVTFTLDDSHVSVWDVTTHNWRLIEGDYDVMVGASVADERLKGTITI